MKKHTMRTSLVLGALCGLLSAASCVLEVPVDRPVEVDASYDLTGRAVNAKASTVEADNCAFYEKTGDATVNLAGTVVTLKDTSNNSYVSTVGADGTFIILGVPNGTYSVSASKTGWTFVPAKRFTVSQDSTTVPDLVAFHESEAGLLTVIMTWDNRETDMDLHMVHGALRPDGDSDGFPDGDNPDTQNPGDYYAKHVGYYNPDVSESNFEVLLSRDVTNDTAAPTNFAASIPLVECISVNQTDFTAGTIIDPNPGDTSDFRVYVNAFNKASGTTGLDIDPIVAPSGTTVHYFQDQQYLGTYYVPLNTAEKLLGMGVVAMDGTAANSAQIWTEIVSDTAVRSLGPAKGVPVKSFQ